MLGSWNIFVKNYYLEQKWKIIIIMYNDVMGIVIFRESYAIKRWIWF